MLIGTINIAMQASTQALVKGLNDARSSLAGFGKSIMSLKGLIAGSFAGAGIAALAHFAEMAAHLEQNIQRLEVVFGDASDSIVKQAEKMNLAFGTSELASTAAAVKMGGLFEALGVARAPAAEMTDQLLVMAQAIASFKHIGFEEAVTKVFAGMAGKGKGLKEFGIAVSATMSAQERFNAIMTGGANIVGNMGQRAGDASNAWKEFHGRIEQLEITLGQHLPEVVGPFFSELSVSLVAAIDWFKNLNNETLNWGEQTLSSGKGAAESIGWVQTAVMGLADAWQAASISFTGFRSVFSEGIAKMLSGPLASLGDGIDALFEKIGLVDKVKPALGTGDLVRIWGDTLHETARKEYEEFKKKMGEPLASEGIATAYKAAHDQIEAARREVTKGVLDAAAAVPHKDIVKDVGKAAGAAIAAGGVGTASVITKGKYQIGDEGHKKKLEKNGDKTNELLAGIKANLEAGGGEPEMWDDL